MRAERRGDWIPGAVDVALIDLRRFAVPGWVAPKAEPVTPKAQPPHQGRTGLGHAKGAARRTKDTAGFPSPTAKPNW